MDTLTLKDFADVGFGIVASFSVFGLLWYMIKELIPEIRKFKEEQSEQLDTHKVELDDIKKNQALQTQILEGLVSQLANEAENSKRLELKTDETRVIAENTDKNVERLFGNVSKAIDKVAESNENIAKSIALNEQTLQLVVKVLDRHDFRSEKIQNEIISMAGKVENLTSEIRNNK